MNHNLFPVATFILLRPRATESADGQRTGSRRARAVRGEFAASGLLRATAGAASKPRGLKSAQTCLHRAVVTVFGRKDSYDARPNDRNT
jgi:hypothetical protein